MASKEAETGPHVPADDHALALAERLRTAIKHQPRQGRKRGLRHFQRLMEERAKATGGALTGVALSSIQNYLSGAASPSWRFLQEAAQVLGVREAWLMSGVGARTDEEEAALRGDDRGERLRTFWAKARPAFAVLFAEIQERLGKAVDEGITQEFPAYPNLPHSVRAAILRGFREFEEYITPQLLPVMSGRSPEDAFGEMAKQFGRYLNAPVELLRLDPEEVSPEAWALIIRAVLEPIAVVAEMHQHSGGDDEEE